MSKENTIPEFLGIILLIGFGISIVSAIVCYLFEKGTVLAKNVSKNIEIDKERKEIIEQTNKSINSYNDAKIRFQNLSSQTLK